MSLCWDDWDLACSFPYILVGSFACADVVLEFFTLSPTQLFYLYLSLHPWSEILFSLQCVQITRDTSVSLTYLHPFPFNNKCANLVAHGSVRTKKLPTDGATYQQPPLTFNTNVNLCDKLQRHYVQGRKKVRLGKNKLSCVNRKVVWTTHASVIELWEQGLTQLC